MQDIFTFSLKYIYFYSCSTAQKLEMHKYGPTPPPEEYIIVWKSNKVAACFTVSAAVGIHN